MEIRPLPQDTHNAARGRPSNFGLAFHRYLAFPDAGNSLDDWRGTQHEEELWKKLERTADVIYGQSGDGSTKKALKQQHERYNHILQVRRDRWGEDAAHKIATTVAWRLLIGLSAPSVLNNGITLHRLFGFPYLPSSGVKGLVSHYRLAEIAGQLGVKPLEPGCVEKRRRTEDSDLQQTPWQKLRSLLLAPNPETYASPERRKEAQRQLEQTFDSLCSEAPGDLMDECPLKDGSCSLQDLRSNSDYGAATFRRVFGSPAQQGAVHFFDALPCNLEANGKSLLERDIVTPHHKEYYTGDGEQPPADYQKPVPVQMLAVRRGAQFVFRLTCSDAELASGVRGWLERAIAFWGAGAKTRAGYGELIVEKPDIA